ncbi:hypothetical protein M5D96_005535 [Drosophila gunungcola]|uniref:Uncharacterized protein n=1 Tax=Drosophila gunungcola TaxID=103775 RepID=A0A9P9YRE5_9MUSC|nr:hypothetical protein M5D96_005535 [Drosophila gunungcola]
MSVRPSVHQSASPLVRPSSRRLKPSAIRVQSRFACLTGLYGLCNSWVLVLVFI